jgi:hypothetical protein
MPPETTEDGFREAIGESGPSRGSVGVDIAKDLPVLQQD